MNHLWMYQWQKVKSLMQDRFKTAISYSPPLKSQVNGKHATLKRPFIKFNDAGVWGRPLNDVLPSKPSTRLIQRKASNPWQYPETQSSSKGCAAVCSDTVRGMGIFLDHKFGIQKMLGGYSTPDGRHTHGGVLCYKACSVTVSHQSIMGISGRHGRPQTKELLQRNKAGSKASGRADLHYNTYTYTAKAFITKEVRCVNPFSQALPIGVSPSGNPKSMQRYMNSLAGIAPKWKFRRGKYVPTGGTGGSWKRMVRKAFKKGDKRLRCATVKVCRPMGIRFTHFCRGTCRSSKDQVQLPVGNTLHKVFRLGEKAIAGSCANF